MVVVFVLPERTMQPKYAEGFVAGEAFERAKPFPRRHVWCDQEVNVIRHDDERMQFVTFESAFAVVEGLDYHFGYFGSTEKHRAALGTIEQLIHGEERLSGCEVGGPEDAADWEASAQAEGYEYSLADDVPMREAPFVPAHFGCSGQRGAIVSQDFVKSCAGRKPGGRAEAPPHRVGNGWSLDG